ncbi:MAG: hypothetical protein EZS28_010168 [Streblomastix strix]|uniref:Uncharacterized protein n=1 Tax=Streblomastix strix TaxID=222440 RepID=A0A5J4WHL4_9EUKA|nr:MAG: hypothetical protein EZS28_010168 [Streblomastix strix]
MIDFENIGFSKNVVKPSQSPVTSSQDQTVPLSTAVLPSHVQFLYRSRTCAESTSDNHKQHKQYDDIKVKSLDRNPIIKVRNRNMRSESSAPAINGLEVYAEIDNIGETKYLKQIYEIREQQLKRRC